MCDVMKTKVLEVVETSGEFEWDGCKGETLEEVLHQASVLLHKWCAPNEIFGGDPVFEDDNGGYHVMTIHATLFDADADGNIIEDGPDPDYPVNIKRWLHEPEIRGPLPMDSDALEELAGVMLRRESLGDPLFRTEKGHYTLRVNAIISPVEADDEIVRERKTSAVCNSMRAFRAQFRTVDIACARGSCVVCVSSWAWTPRERRQWRRFSSEPCAVT